MTRLHFVMLAALAASTYLACASKPPGPCDYTEDQFEAALGKIEPKALDLDEDGVVTVRDWALWLERCG